MPSTQLMDSPIQLWVNYNISPPQITSISVANPMPYSTTAMVQRNNGQWTSFNIPAQMPKTDFAVNQAQYQCTVTADGQLDVCPDLQL